MRFRPLLATALVVVAAACGAYHEKTEAERTVRDVARGVSYVAPPGWSIFEGEIRSPSGSLLTLRVYDLVEAEKKFVAGLPDTLFPQLTDWAKYYFVVEGPPTRVETMVAGLPATELTYPIRIRPQDTLSKVVYWVIKRDTRLFVLRAAFPPKGLPDDEAAVRKVVAGWSFLETPKSGA